MKKVEVNLQVHRASACVQVVVMCYMYVVSSLYLDLVVHVLQFKKQYMHKLLRFSKRANYCFFKKGGAQILTCKL